MNRNEYSEDYFADTRMSFGDHIEDLRIHLMRAIYGFIVALVVGLFLGNTVLGIIREPVEEALTEYYIDYYKKTPHKDNRVVRELLRLVNEGTTDGNELDPALQGLDQPRKIAHQISRRDFDELLRAWYPQLFAKDGQLAEAPKPADDSDYLPLTLEVRPLRFIHELGPVIALAAKRTSLTTLGAEEALMVYLLVSILTGLTIGSPWIIFQVWSFIAAGLYPHEQKYVTRYLPFSIGLFVGGVLLCQFLVIPNALNVLLDFNRWLGFEPDLRLTNWLVFAIMLPLVFGISFQLPLVMMFMERINVFTPEDFAAKRRIAFFVLAIFCALITPTMDAITMMWLWVPLIGLYELGYRLANWMHKKTEIEAEDYEVAYDPGVHGGDGEGSDR